MDILDIESCYKLGVKLKEQGNLAEAERCFRLIVDHDPELPDPQHSLGVVLQLQGRIREAIDRYHCAIVLDPCFVKAHYNLANACLRLGLYTEAEASARATVLCDPKHANAHWLLGMLLLQQGDFENGWQEYEWRWKAQGFTSKVPDLKQPQWDGAPLSGRTLLLHMEQGRGDMIQFVRYAALAAATGGRVVVCALPELVPLLATATGVSQSVDREGDLPGFDVHAPVQSLPYILGTTLDTIPADVPYISPDPIKIKKWQQMLSADKQLRIGLAWQGTPVHIDDHNRSCALTGFLPLADLTGITFYSLQLGCGSEQVSSLQSAMKVVDHTANIHDFSDTAAFIANLDLVISVDTAVAHLAGALGKPVWTLLPFISEWRWLLDRENTPWYPSMRLFRQTSPCDWEGVMGAVRQALVKLLDVQDFSCRAGIDLLRSGAVAEAERVFAVAVSQRPDDAEAHCNRGVALDELGRREEAVACYQEALLHKPDYMPAVYNMGNSCLSLGRLDQARICYEYVLELAPDFVPAHLALGEMAKKRHDYSTAITHYQTASTIDPLSVDAFLGVADSFQAKERYDEAIAVYRHVLTLEPGRINALNMLGSVYQCIEQLENAEICYRDALILAPDRSTILNNLGTVLNAQGRFQEASETFRHLLKMDPDYAEGHWNLALVLLAMGEYKDGWREYEWRFKKTQPVPKRDFSQPCWDGAFLEGQTVLLHCEQGFGDTLQFVRYVPLVARCGGKVIIECQVPALKRLLLSVEGVDTVIAAGEPFPPFDCHLHLLSLPLVFGTTLETIPACVPYLAAELTDINEWRRRLGSSDTFRVGLVWFGRQNQVLNRKRSCPLEYFAPLAEIPNIEFFSLQIDEGSEQLNEHFFGFKINNLTADINDFADSAAFIANLDLVITIDTAVAHLAGAVGARTWVLLPHGADWRWLQNSKISPWYPTIRLFRQPKAGDWLSVMADVSAALRECVYDNYKHEKISSETQLSNIAVSNMEEIYRVDSNGGNSELRNRNKMRVGLAWSCRRNNPLTLNRICPINALAPLFELPNVIFFSLQIGEHDDYAKNPLPLLDLTAHVRNFEDTAALMANLDLIISVDTSVAHLAAAIGRPTWVLLPHIAEWRWLLDRDDSPWYPALRLFRQPDFGDWQSVIHEVSIQLSLLSDNRQNKIISKSCFPHCSGISPDRLLLEQVLDRHNSIFIQDISNPDALLDVGTSLAQLGRFREAAASFRKVIEMDSEHVTGHINLAYSLLALGEYTEGLRHFEWRLKKIPKNLLPPWPMLQPAQLGIHPSGTSVLVHCEQGYGDTIMFSRYLPLLADAGYRVVVSCPPPLESLIASIDVVKQVVLHGEMLPCCDLQVLLLSLPYLFSATLETIPACIPYLYAREQLKEAWNNRITENLQKM